MVLTSSYEERYTRSMIYTMDTSKLQLRKGYAHTSARL